ncbi:hypothetical protein PUW24_07235 [Paenibacillus urinalis]|uniref:HTH-like domain-containing protein n=1 Tax=Paenibacillus urinalis TaxID=521520 RepID=A0ABY7XCT1_9BACL|nr:hypothetical protein [Paenibacillus urinalis]OMG46259.1 hypothetical protein BK140_27735 [Paenibacillus macerans]WDH98704.1 hypothetical protein PUW24_07235 [Paenibacillus urinalis]WDI02397.1 hypothetical protein PUW25_24955 [Paenibacillus urinalis]
MTVTELGKILRDMYRSAPHGNQVAMIHLFGIKYADVILKNGFGVKEIVVASGIRQSYTTEVSKGVKLSEYVITRE